MRYLSRFNKFVNEQNTPKTVVTKGTDTVTKAEFPKQKIGDSFPNKIPQGGTIEALYKSDAVKKNIADLKPKIEQFIKDNPEQTKFVLTISAGESQVTNPDKFKTPGSLALARANAVKDYVNEIFADLIKSGKLTIVSPKDEKEVKIGTTGYKDLNTQQRKDNADAYKTEQFVDIDLKGAGQKTVKGKDIVRTFCGQKVQSGGEALLPQDGYAHRQVVKLGPGEGKITITLDAIKLPDVLYVEYNGKTYGDSRMRGDNLYGLIVGTSMYNAFESNDKIPPAWGDKNKFKVLDLDNKEDYETLIDGFVRAAQYPLIWDWNSIDNEDPSDAYPDKWGLFYNTFGHSKSELRNEDIMKAMIDYDKRTKYGRNADTVSEKKMRRCAKDLVEDLKPFGMKWANLTTGAIYPGYYNIEIDKIDGVDEITIIDCAPCGATKWRGVIKCNDQEEKPKHYSEFDKPAEATIAYDGRVG